jgi:hypothetical protein
LFYCSNLFARSQDGRLSPAGLGHVLAPLQVVLGDVDVSLQLVLAEEVVEDAGERSVAQDFQLERAKSGIRKKENNVKVMNLLLFFVQKKHCKGMFVLQNLNQFHTRLV